MAFGPFIDQLRANPLLLLSVVLTLGVILVNGWTDAPNAIATCVVTRCLSVRAAIGLAAAFNFIGVLWMTRLNAGVAVTITQMVDFGNDPRGAVVAISAAMLGIVVWATLAWALGIPTSESHALIAGLTGSAIALHGSLDRVNGGEWVKVLYGLVVSILLGFGLGWLVCRAVMGIFKRAERRKTAIGFRYAQILGAACMSFMHGAQDGQKFMGVILLCTWLADGQGLSATVAPPEWMMLVCSVVMGLGTAIGGKRIIQSVGMDMVKLEKYQGFSADVASSLALLFCSVFGLPVSTTHTKATAIMGVGATRRLSAINVSVVKEMALTWVLTFPGCGLVGFGMTRLFMWVFQ
jgi:PiT family inorganic phosphate transporter